jgi:GTPase SAR1 family protein
VFLGDSGVGKTNMIANFVKGVVGGPPKGPTLGIEYSSKTIPIDAQHTVKAQIWDTAGQEQFRSVTTK